MPNIEKAITAFDEGFNCAQAVFATSAEQFGLDHEVALKIAGAFGGGMASMGDTCGAVTGAFMVIGTFINSPMCSQSGLRNFMTL